MTIAAAVSRLDTALHENTRKRLRAAALRRQAKGAVARTVAISAHYKARQWTRLAGLAYGGSEGPVAVDKNQLRQSAREAILTGKLPAGVSYRSWGGPSSGGAVCAVCDQKVLLRELEYELEFEHEDGHVTPSMFHLHIRCFQAWEYQRRLLR